MITQMAMLCQKQEGFRAFPYTDTTGNLTIGYGTNLKAGITTEQGSGLFYCQESANSVRLLAFDWFASLDAIRQGVVENMAYNMGVDDVLLFHRMIFSLSRHDYISAASAMLDSDWAKEVGNRATVLAQIMRSGLMPSD